MKPATVFVYSIIIGSALLMHSPSAMAEDMGYDHGSKGAIEVLEDVPVSFVIDSEQYSLMKLEDISDETSAAWDEIVDANVVKDGFIVLPANSSFSNARYHLIVYESKGLPDAFSDLSLSKSFEEGLAHFDFMDASESILDTFYQASTLFGLLKTDEEYYYTDEACFFVLKNLSGKDGSLRLTTYIDGYTISISAFLGDPAFENQMKTALNCVADGMTRGDYSGTLAAEIRTNGMAKKPGYVSYIGELPGAVLYDQEHYNHDF